MKRSGFVKPSIRNVWYNLPLSVTAISFMTLVLYILPSILTLSVASVLILVVSAFMHVTYEDLRNKVTKTSLLVSAVVCMIFIYPFYQRNLYSVLPKIDTLCGEGHAWIYYVSCVCLWVLSTIFATFLFGWILEKGDDNQEFLCSRILKSKTLKVTIRCCVVISVCMFVIFSFDLNIWGDECFTLRTIALSYSEEFHLTALYDNHPPLYYIMLKAWVDILTFKSTNMRFIIVVARLFSLFAYILTGVLCYKKLKNSRMSSSHWLLLLSFSVPVILIRYGVEIRMYSWALFFVTATLLYARDITIGQGRTKTWLLIIFYSICAAYTHYYALISVSVIWISMLLWIIRNDRQMLKTWFICAFVVAIVFFPWIFVAIKQAQIFYPWIHVSPQSIIGFIGSFFQPLPVILLLLLLFIEVKEKGWRKISCFAKMSLLVPFFTILIGCIISLAYSHPVIVFRYIIPTLLCFWISIFCIFQHSREKIKIFFTILVLWAFLISMLKYTKDFMNDCKKFNATIEFLEQIPSNEEPVFVLTVSPDYTWDVMMLRCWTNKEIVTCMSDVPMNIRQMCPNVLFFENNEDMWKYLREIGSNIYCVQYFDTVKDEFPTPSGYTKKYIGKYMFDKYRYHLVYKLAANSFL